MWKDEVDNDRGVNKELIGNYLTWNQMPICLICYQAIAVGESEGVPYSVHGFLLDCITAEAIDYDC